MQKTNENLLKKNEPDALLYLLGESRNELLKYCFQKKNFYQAEAARELKWSVNDTQYHLNNFVKHNLLERIPTKTKVYYNFNPQNIQNLFKNLK